jgi:hypothetical protein
MADDHQINVIITADTTDLTGKMPEAAASIQEFSQDSADTVDTLNKALQDAAQMSQKQWQQIMAPINRAFDESVDGVLKGTQTISQAVAKLGQNIALSVVNQGIDSVIDALPMMVTQWLAGETAMTGATMAGNAERTASNTTAATDGAAVESDANKQSVIGNAWAAAAAVYNNVAQIPYVGWILAPAAAAAAATAVIGFGANIPSAAGGWVVPSDQLAMVHENEMILPAKYTSMFNSMAASGGGAGGSGGGDTHVHFNVSAMDQQSVSQFFMSNGKHIAGAVSRQVRNGNQTLRQAAGG